MEKRLDQLPDMLGPKGSSPLPHWLGLPGLQVRAISCVLWWQNQQDTGLGFNLRGKQGSRTIRIWGWRNHKGCNQTQLQPPDCHYFLAAAGTESDGRLLRFTRFLHLTFEDFTWSFCCICISVRGRRTPLRPKRIILMQFFVWNL